MSSEKDIEQFLAGWQTDLLNLKPAFEEYRSFLSAWPTVELSFNSRPGISYSLRAGSPAQKGRDLFVLVDVIDDDPASRWLSVCFYADMIDDPDEFGDFVPGGLLGEDALCFNLDEDDEDLKGYIQDRIKQAAEKAAK